jgi:hypothetical protein
MNYGGDTHLISTLSIGGRVAGYRKQNETTYSKCTKVIKNFLQWG